MTTRIHPTAVVDSGAEIGEGVEIGPYVVVEAGVRIGAGARIHPGAVIGGPPQDFHYRGEPTFVEIGPETIIREHVTVNRATTPGGTTRIGARCMLMACSHVGHDCEVGDDVVLANGTLLGGHVQVGDRTRFGGVATVQQFTRIGRIAMIGGAAGLSTDVPPFFMAKSITQNRVVGLNTIGLRRAGISSAARLALRAAFRKLYRAGLTFPEAFAALDADPTPEVQELVRFCRAAKRMTPYAGRGSSRSSEPLTSDETS